jgi:hypothetical protein
VDPDEDTPTDSPASRRASSTDLEEAARRGAERAIEETGRHYLPRPTSTPPALGWWEARIGRFFTRQLLPHLLTAGITAGIVWAVRDCLAH